MLHFLQNATYRFTLQWRNNGRDGVSNHQHHDCLLNRLFRRRWNKTSKLRITGLFAGNSPVAGEFPAQMASNAEKVSTGMIWWRHHEMIWDSCLYILRLKLGNNVKIVLPETGKTPFSQNNKNSAHFRSYLKHCFSGFTAFKTICIYLYIRIRVCMWVHRCSDILYVMLISIVGYFFYLCH